MDYKNFIRKGIGTSDMTPLLKDKIAFGSLIDDIKKISQNFQFDKVACVEGGGFLLGSPIAYFSKAGLVQVRTAGKLRNDSYSASYVDYSKSEKILEIQKDAIEKAIGSKLK